MLIHERRSATLSFPLRPEGGAQAARTLGASLEVHLILLLPFRRLLPVKYVGTEDLADDLLVVLEHRVLRMRLAGMAQEKHLWTYAKLALDQSAKGAGDLLELDGVDDAAGASSRRSDCAATATRGALVPDQSRAVALGKLSAGNSPEELSSFASEEARYTHVEALEALLELVDGLLGGGYRGS